MAPWLHSQILVTSDDGNSPGHKWELTCDGLAVPITGGAPYAEMHAVPPSSCMLHLMDDYGDGWNFRRPSGNRTCFWGGDLGVAKPNPDP